MSTRRARIKAVTSLPPRRKNNDNADKNKTTSVSKDEVETTLKSPKTPRTSLKNQESLERSSPVTKQTSPLKSPRGVNNVVVSQTERVPSPAVNNEVPKDVPKTPKISEKVSVITSTSSVKSVFVSPKSVGSPIRKPAAPTPKHAMIEIEVQKLKTPEKAAESPKHKNDSNITADVNKTEKAKEVPVISTVAGAKSDVPDGMFHHSFSSLVKTLCHIRYLLL